MEDFRHCPICLEVPEQEIFQCSEGHIICHLCLSKVSGGRCPQCRISFGRKKIRCRVLEGILDSQKFECKFKDKGCADSTKRGEMTSHANLCAFNPDTVPLCKQLGFNDCRFRVGFVSRDEFITHFQTVHQTRLTVAADGSWFTMIASDQMAGILTKLKDRKRKKVGGVTGTVVRFWKFVSPNNCVTSPLFLVFGFANRPIGSLSLVGFKVWDSGSNPSTKYNFEFRLTKAAPTADDLSESSGSPFKEIVNLFPIGGSMNVGGVKDAQHVLKVFPINVSMSLLEDSQFGSNVEDKFLVKISPII